MDIVALQPGTTLANIVKLVGSKKRKAILARPTEKVALSGLASYHGKFADIDYKASGLPL